MNEEQAKEILWNRCQHTPETAEAIRVLSEERPQGEWKYTHDTFSKRICNKCNYSQVIVDGMADNFCPNCGASMKGGAE